MTLPQPEKVKNYDITKEDAEDLLKPYFPILSGIVKTGWADWESLTDEQRAKLDARARANCVNSFIVHNARGVFDDTNDVKVTDARGLFLLDFQDELNLRFKKLTKNKKPSNVSTNQQVEFSMQMALPNMPKVVRLTLGYILDATQTVISDILIVYHQGRKLAWEISILNSQSSVVQLPFPNIESQKRNVKVTAKANKLKRQTKEK